MNLNRAFQFVETQSYSDGSVIAFKCPHCDFLSTVQIEAANHVSACTMG